MAMDSIRAVMGGAADADDAGVRPSAAQDARDGWMAGGRWDAERLFLCPDRDGEGFLPSLR
ncbi:MAG: hypothetical protein JWM27_886 [Gemmatimonadetes bacterium]|nr:hypothetical protein [Gemmatimonadota bacterium]